MKQSIILPLAFAALILAPSVGQAGQWERSDRLRLRDESRSHAREFRHEFRDRYRHEYRDAIRRAMRETRRALRDALRDRC